MPEPTPEGAVAAAARALRAALARVPALSEYHFDYAHGKLEITMTTRRAL